MWINLFVAIYIVEDFFLSDIEAPSKLKRKKSMDITTAATEKINDTLSIINEKRREWENNHHTGFSTTSEEYITWPEIMELNQKEFCDKFISKLFENNPRIVESATIIPAVWLNYTELLNTDRKKIDPVNVKALRCAVTPRYNSRKYIYFIRASKTDCLYMLNNLIVRAQKFYIAREVCLAGEYKFLKMRGLNKYAKSCRNACKNDTVDERRQYEIDHFQDFKLNAEEYKLWPLLKINEKNEFCKGFLRKLIPGFEFSKIYGIVNELELQYREILEWEDGALLQVNVSALDCKIPDKKRRNSYQFVKAAMHGCVYLVTPVNPNCNTYYIAKQLCGNEIPQIGPEIRHHVDDDFMNSLMDAKFIKLLNKGVQNEVMEVSSVDQHLISLFDQDN